MKTIQDILNGKNKPMKKALFLFSSQNTYEEIIFKFNLWSRYFFANYFTSDDAPFHNEMDTNNLKAYYGDIDSFTDVVFRGGGKTARTKLFVAFFIANDEDHTRKYIKVLSSDGKNSKQISTDIYNMLITIKELYPEIFEKTITKREETMNSFTTTTGVKLVAGTVGTEQRGALQEDSRPDYQWFEDFESRKTIRSSVITKSIWDNMEEARTGGAKDSPCIYTCNYISEAGNVHKLVHKENDRNVVMIVPIIKDDVISWDRYTMEDIEQMKEIDEDFAGERMCEPSAGKDIYFDRQKLEKMEIKTPIRISAEFKIYHEFNPAHRIGSGHDVSGGIGFDSSTSVFIDFSTVPARVVGTFASNTIKPEAFGHEVYREQEMFGGCISAVENNFGTEAIQVLKQKDANLFTTKARSDIIEEGEETRYGWNTNTLSKGNMLQALFSALEDGLLELSDKDLIQEVKSYTRHDSIENVKDPRLTTRHFDLVMACFVKGTNILTDKGQKPIEEIKVGDMVMTRKGYRRVKNKIQHIKKVISNIGLTGTPDHPVFSNNNKIKDLKDITYKDKLYIWNKQKIERLSYIKAQNIIDTQNRSIETIDCTSWEEQNGKLVLFTYIEKFGLICLEKLLKGLSYIIRMGTQVITKLKILKCFLDENICGNTWKTKEEKSKLGSVLRKTEVKSTKEYENIIKTKKKQKQSVRFVKRFFMRLQKMLYTVQEDVVEKLEKKKIKNQNKQKHVKYVRNNLKLESHIKKDVQRSVARKGGEYQLVYNIEVEGVHEYFANNILVHNCCIAWQMKDYAREPHDDFNKLMENNEHAYDENEYE